jgi:hypothetical protein
MGRKFSKTAITFEGRAMSRNPFRVFTTSIYSIDEGEGEGAMRVRGVFEVKQYPSGSG